MALGGGTTSSGLVIALLLSCVCVSKGAILFNITQILSAYPDYSQLNDWLSRTGVADEINNRSTITVLAPNNAVLGAYLGSVPDAYNNPDKVGDTLRYHVLLGYYGILELQELPANGSSVTTLLQTTGRANESQGFVTLYNNGTAFLVGHEFTDAFGNETILSNITQVPFIYSVLQVSSILTPVPPSLPSPAPAPSPFSKVPTGAPTLTPPPGTVTAGPVASQVASPQGNHANTKSASKLLVLLAMLFASGAALL